MREAFQVCAKNSWRSRKSHLEFYPQGLDGPLRGAVATDFVKYTGGANVAENNADRMQPAWLDSIHLHAASWLYY